MVKDQYPAAVSEATSAILPQWLTALHDHLAQDLAADLTTERWDNLAVRHEAFKALDTVLSSFSKTVQPQASEWLHIALQHLFGLADAFRQHILLADADGGPQLSEEASDVSADLSKLIGQIIDWTQHLCRKPWARPLLMDAASKEPTQALSAALSICLNFSQATAEEEETWQDPNAFVTDQDDEGVAFSLRMACLDLLGVRPPHGQIMSVLANCAKVAVATRRPCRRSSARPSCSLCRRQPSRPWKQRIKPAQGAKRNGV